MSDKENYEDKFYIQNYIPINLFVKFAVQSIKCMIFKEFFMKKYIVSSLIMLFAFIHLNAQQSINSIFTNVPVVNGRVIFQQFIPTDNSLSADQKYGFLTKWGRDNYAGNRLVTSIRFNEKDRNISISSKSDLPTVNGIDKLTMNYRFDVSVTNGGYMLTIRDISYDIISKGTSKTYPAEEIITDVAVSSSGDLKEVRIAARKETLALCNSIYDSLFQSLAKKSH